MQQEEMEILLWEYIDGRCSAADYQYISQLIVSNDTWHKVYEELSTLNNSLTNNIELEQPSLRFTQNIMDIVGYNNPARAAETYVNRTIPKLVFYFSLFTIAYLIIDAFQLAGESGDTPALITSVEKKLLELYHLNNVSVNILITINIILGLLLLDTFLRKGMTSKKLKS